eukprot:jgi/Chlat1/8447/Chrsp80S07857
MATADDRPLPSVVGRAFVTQYYQVLHSAPRFLHRFYTDDSTFTHAEFGSDTPADSVKSQRDIHVKVSGLEYEDSKAEILTVDSQYSLDGGVIVLVTGTLTTKKTPCRNFVQTFFLAPQERGYYVLNDVFRFLDGGSASAPAPAPASAKAPLANGYAEPPAAAAPAPAPVKESPAKAAAPPASPPPAAEREVISSPKAAPVAEAVASPKAASAPQPAAPASPVPKAAPAAPAAPPPMQAAAPPAAPEGDQPAEDNDKPKKPLTYASILRTMKEASAVSQSQVAAPVVDAAEPTANFNEAPVAATSAAPDAGDEASAAEDDGKCCKHVDTDGKSIFVKNLPHSITVATIEKEFAKFGPLKPNGIILKNQKPGGCYAFIDFEEASAVQAAMEATIVIDNRDISVEPKRPMPGRGKPRGGGMGGGMQRGTYRTRGSTGPMRGGGRGAASADRGPVTDRPYTPSRGGGSQQTQSRGRGGPPRGRGTGTAPTPRPSSGGTAPAPANA